MLPGLLFMLLAAGAVGWLISLVAGALVGAAVGAILFICWHFLNVYHSTTGLIKANLRVYFHHRIKGESVEDALESMIGRRYPFSKSKRERAEELVFGLPESEWDVSSEWVQMAVYTIFRLENGEPSERVQWHIQLAIKQHYMRSWMQLMLLYPDLDG